MGHVAKFASTNNHILLVAAPGLLQCSYSSDTAKSDGFLVSRTSAHERNDLASKRT
jgi:hypothetical protein